MIDADVERSDDEDREEDEYDDDEELSEEERRKRRLKREAKEKVEKSLGKGGRKVDSGFMGAYSGYENAEKYLRRHQFKYGAEPKDKVPETKPSSAGGELWTEPSRWIPPKPAENYPAKAVEAEPEQSGREYKSHAEMVREFLEILSDPDKVDALLGGPTEDIDILETPNTEHDGRQPDGAHKTQIQKEEIDYREVGGNQEDDLTVDIDTPLLSANQVAAEITSKFEDAGYEAVSSETVSDVGTGPKSLESPIDAPLSTEQEIVEEDSISPLELSEQHEKIRRHAIKEIVEEQQQELLQDFELTPENMPLESEEDY